MENNLDFKLKLLTGRDIEFYGEYIKQPKIGEIIDYGWTEFFELICLPYIINFEYVNIPSEYIKEHNIKIFDVFWLPDFTIKENLVLELLIKSLKILFKVDNVEIDYNEYSLTVGKLIINRNNFDEFANIIRMILKVNEYKKLKKDNIENLSPSVRAKYEKYKRNQEKNKNNDDNDILKVMNYIIHNQGFLNYSCILGLTIFQLFNTQDTFINKDGYDTNWNIVIAGNRDKNIDLTHWMTKFKMPVEILSTGFKNNKLK